jgi:hypothetical protein
MKGIQIFFKSPLFVSMATGAKFGRLDEIQNGITMETEVPK